MSHCFLFVAVSLAQVLSMLTIFSITGCSSTSGSPVLAVPLTQPYTHPEHQLASVTRRWPGNFENNLLNGSAVLMVLIVFCTLSLNTDCQQPSPVFSYIFSNICHASCCIATPCLQACIGAMTNHQVDCDFKIWYGGPMTSNSRFYTGCMILDPDTRISEVAKLPGSL